MPTYKSYNNSAWMRLPTCPHIRSFLSYNLVYLDKSEWNKRLGHWYRNTAYKLGISKTYTVKSFIQF